MPATLQKDKGGHSYQNANRLLECAFGCGCWNADVRFGGPSGIDPLGECPKNPSREEIRGQLKLVAAKDLVGKDLTCFIVRECEAVVDLIDLGHTERMVALFDNPGAAQAFLAVCGGEPRRRQIFALTDGTTAFPLENPTELRAHF